MAWFCVSSRVYHLRPIILALGKITKAIIGLGRSPIVSFPACCVRVIATIMLIEESGIFNSFTVFGERLLLTNNEAKITCGLKLFYWVKKN